MSNITVEVLNYNITTSLEALDINKRTIANTINPHSYCIAKKDNDFDNALKSSDILLPDGIGIVWATKLLRGKKIIKIAGFDLFIHLMKQLNTTNGSCFFLGASVDTLQKIQQKALTDYPNVKVYAFSPPYKKMFTESDTKQMINEVNKVQPQVLFVGMTAPKQEKWVYKNKDKIQANVLCSIGAVFDFYAGTVKRPSKFWINLGLEWLPRLVKEPKRLWRRNLISSPLFLWYLFLEKIK